MLLRYLPANNFVTKPQFIRSSTKSDLEEPSSVKALTKSLLTDACSSFWSAS